jgi:hypothetical protein
MNANKPQAVAMMKDFYAKGGVSISDASMRKEFDTRPTFDLGQQMSMMNRSGGNSQVDAWFAQIAVFMRETGSLSSIPQVQDFVTGEYMAMVQNDPKLREFANSTK